MRKGPPPAATVNGVQFSRREWQMANLIAEGHLHTNISGMIGIADGTMKIYMSRLYDRMRRVHPEVANLNLSIVLAQWVAFHRCGVYCTNPAKANPSGICCAVPAEGSDRNAVLGTPARDAGSKRPARENEGAAVQEDDGAEPPWDEV